MNWDQIESKWRDMTRRVQGYSSPGADRASAMPDARAGMAGASVVPVGEGMAAARHVPSARPTIE